MLMKIPDDTEGHTIDETLSKSATKLRSYASMLRGKEGMKREAAECTMLASELDSIRLAMGMLSNMKPSK